MLYIVSHVGNSFYYYIIGSKMERNQSIFVQNLKKYRRNCGLTQEQLAEKVNVSTHHIGMIESSRNNPTLDLVERIAKALNIKVYELFMDPLSPNEELERLRLEIRDDMIQLLGETLDKALSINSRKKRSKVVRAPCTNTAGGTAGIVEN
jgi:transcriptional regulator with XRE-family HTH domain